ncbi:PREDICTED: uncharacterized protein LOC109212300 [Nicotiana attenuata]|uniref:uncharacterized protein LOC109212300 n=1 Tax=Nicotiana attenuata TaxID=49451 RepID=UPI000904ACB7|nr:PREDICTED: uncharacterized protein LOC109212300 [Nicotiana attenuata]
MAHLRTIGCLCFATVTERVDKFSPRAITTVHMGYSVSQKGYKLYDLRQRKFFVSRDVTFKEDVFLFQLGKDDAQQAPMFLELKSREEGHSLHQQQTHTPEEEHENVNQDFVHDHDLVQHENGQDPAKQAPVAEAGHREQMPTTEVTENVQVSQLRRSSRGSKPPIWMKDYVCPLNGASSSTCMYPISNYLSYSALSTTYQSYLTATLQETEPASYTEAMKDPRWVEAMRRKWMVWL